MKQQKIVKTLNSYFYAAKTEPRIDLAYIFGSHAAGKEGPISDYDIAVLYSKPIQSALRYKLTHELNKVLKTDQIDLVVLNNAPIELRYTVIAT